MPMTGNHAERRRHWHAQVVELALVIAREAGAIDAKEEERSIQARALVSSLNGWSWLIANAYAAATS